MVCDLYFQNYEEYHVPVMDTARKFICLNRKPHPHRVSLVNELLSAGLQEQGFVSLGLPGDRAIILNETFDISNINDDICDINDDTIIASLRYNNIRDIKEDIKYCINYTSHLKDIKLKKYLEDFLFENHYKMIFKSGCLTDRFKNINSNICYNSIYRNIFNNNYNDTIKKYNILPLKCSNIVKLLHSIDPSITGSFIDYLIRRIICELLNIEFDDSRTCRSLDNVNHICNGEDCRYSIEFEYQDEKEVFKKICTLPYCRLHSYNLTKLDSY
jgi:hypothetical protein